MTTEGLTAGRVRGLCAELDNLARSPRFAAAHRVLLEHVIAALKELSPREDADLDTLAEALANTEDGYGGDGCFDRIREWEAQEEWERQAHPDDYPDSDYEDREQWRRLARTATTHLGASRTVETAEEWEPIRAALRRRAEMVAPGLDMTVIEEIRRAVPPTPEAEENAQRDAALAQFEADGLTSRQALNAFHGFPLDCTPPTPEGATDAP